MVPAWRCDIFYFTCEILSIYKTQRLLFGSFLYLLDSEKQVGDVETLDEVLPAQSNDVLAAVFSDACISHSVPELMIMMSNIDF